MFYHWGIVYTDFPIFRQVFQYGYLGVDLFFIISGFVVALSAEGRNFRQFVISRISRLYPMLWVSVTLTTIVACIWGYVVDFKISVLQYITNLTMVPSLVHQPLVDGSYWSLAVELKFYAFIGALVLLGLFSYIKEISLGLSVGLFVAVFFFGLSPNYISYFVAGMIFYCIYRRGLQLETLFALGLLLPVSLKYATYWAPSLSTGYHYPFSPYIIALNISIFYLLFLGISTKKIHIQNTKLFSILGAITYPIYLLHQEIGRVLYAIFEQNGFNHWVAFVLIVMLIVGVSFMLQKYYEKRMQLIVRRVLSLVLKV
jgi:peptidoglycan/LPS O-acetylase OafA/YrhL